ncbi:sulfite exporter TauE/SafE family protein [Lederbergia citrea]|uniref:sulfite exporter TauE/SafE family protein n=1 Tax=Lederbergia citrea TaxID=2833581 RepID=UPI002015E5C2|nr:sulfite exporter TauE/SafE family protein [Lederbergia citrea]
MHHWGSLRIALIYFLVGLVASTLGAMAGLGGGIIIKPALDFLGHYDVTTIGILSAATVFSMACVSLINAARARIKVKGKISFVLALGSIAGGIFGKLTLNHLVGQIENQNIITVFQAGILATLMLVIFLFVKNKAKIETYQLHNIVIIFIVGFGLGTFSSFLGIGGGPLNMATLALAFSMSTKESTINSIFIIFFSQLASLAMTASTTGFADLDIQVLGFMIVGGGLGGLIGAVIYQRISNRQIEKVFNFTLLAILFLNIYNMVRYLI